MPTYDQASADCHVFTFKDGMLSAVAHDLKLKVSAFRVDVDASAGTVEGSFDTASVRFVTAMKDGRDNPGAMGMDAKKIEKSIVKDVLKPKKHPKATFSATEVAAVGDGYKVTGRLTLGGVTKTISADVERRGDRLEATVKIHQPDYRIKPFSAMLGALKVRPGIEVRLSVPVPK